MKVALYVGDHREDRLVSRLGWALVRLAQKGALSRVTHVEAIHAELPDGRVVIASSSLRDGGVRSHAVRMTPENWLVVDVPSWSLSQSVEWFAAHDGMPYDVRGALATQLPGAHRTGEWFCSEAVGASIGLLQPHTFGPHQFAAIALTLGRDVTGAFFAQR